MNQDSSSSWSQTLSEEPLATASGDDDFTNFLDLGIDFPDFDGLENGQPGLDTSMGGLGIEQLGMEDSANDAGADQMYLSMRTSQARSIPTMHAHAKHMESIDPVLHAHLLHQQYQQALQNQNFHREVMILPTPQSSEMQGAARYYQQMDAQGQTTYDRNQASFTPLVSPAVTPLETNFHMPDYAIPGEYFSPLTSPAIEAQNHQIRRPGYSRGPGSEAGAGTSPLDASIDLSSSKTPPTPAARKGRRKPSVSGRTPARSVRQSPMMKPQGRRKQNTINTTSAGIAELAENAHETSLSLLPSTTLQRPVGSSGESGTESVSPEPLTESLMPPPAIPRSSGKSPNISEQSKAPGTGGSEPATPATLMRLQSNSKVSPQTLAQNAGSITSEMGESMEEIMLPESATSSRPNLAPLNTSDVTIDDLATPTISAKTPKLSAGSTPRSSALSPQLMSPGTMPLHKRADSKSGVRSSKKRPGTTPSQVSPALRPKISPSIKPLVPNSGPGMPGLSAETSALYLASKSNYQNILEGTHLPGVSYPEALAENLSSKRTSHKIAEQGRRNRINTALKEIEALLPPTPTVSGKKDRASSNDGEGSDKGGAAGQNNSKASTVEMAIIYIKALQLDLVQTKAKLEVAEKKLAEGHSNSSQASE